ncbi:MAG: hypothetical protein V7607_1677 [Solirubrobacteraceae bacterium]
MSEVVIVSRLRARPGREDETERALRSLIAPTHGEDGVVLYALHRGVDDPSLFYFIEQFETREHLERHLQSDHVQGFGAMAEELLAERPPFDVMRAVPDGEPSKGRLRGGR